MSLLHIVNKSPTERYSLLQCIARMLPGSTLLLIEDGVTAALNDSQTADLMACIPKGCKIAVLQPDLEMRGLDKKDLVKGIKRVGYTDFVELTTKHSAVSSWQ